MARLLPPLVLLSSLHVASAVNAAPPPPQAAPPSEAPAGTTLPAAEAGPDQTADAAAVAEEAEQKRVTSRDFAGINFGVGLTLTLDTGDNDRVDKVELDEAGVVRVGDINNFVPRVMLESHYLFTFGSQETFGCGPFVALQPGTDEIIEAIGAGAMFAVRATPTSATSFNFGVGIVYDPNVTVLGAGIVANQELPAGEKAAGVKTVRVREKGQRGLLFLVSFSWF